MDQWDAHAQHVGGDDDCDDRVEPVPSGRGRRGDAHDHAHGGPDIGHQVLRIGLEGDRFVPPASPEEHPRHAEIDEGGRRRDGDAHSRVMDRLRIEQPAARTDHDAGRGDENQRAFEAARKILGLGMAVGVIFVGRPGRDGQRDERHHRRHQVDQRFERVREESDGTGEEVGGALERDGDQRGQQRQRGVADDAGTTRHRTGSGSRRATSAMVCGALPSARLFTRRYAGIRACTAVSIRRTRSPRSPGLGSWILS